MTLDESGIRELLAAYIAQAGDVSKAARKLGIRKQALHQMLQPGRNVSKDVAKILGFIKCRTYQYEQASTRALD